MKVRATPDQVRAFLAYLDQGVPLREAAVKVGMSPRWGYSQTQRRSRGTTTSKGPSDRHLRSRYGITQAAYEQMFHQQGGCCAICGDPPAAQPLAVDHSHARGHVRGLLCGQCNRGLGHFKDNPELLQKAMLYIVERGA